MEKIMAPDLNKHLRATNEQEFRHRLSICQSMHWTPRNTQWLLQQWATGASGSRRRASVSAGEYTPVRSRMSRSSSSRASTSSRVAAAAPASHASPGPLSEHKSPFVNSFYFQSCLYSYRKYSDCTTVTNYAVLDEVQQSNYTNSTRTVLG